MFSHLRSVREAMMKWTNLWDGSEPASLFMSKWLVFVDLPRTWPHQIDQLRDPGKEGAEFLPYIKKTSSFVLIWPESQPRALYLHSWSYSVELWWPLRLNITAWLLHSSTVGEQPQCTHEFHLVSNWYAVCARFHPQLLICHSIKAIRVSCEVPFGVRWSYTRV